MANMGGQFRLTKEESALMDECRKSSFWYRSVPLMAISTAIMTYRRVNSQMPPKYYGLKVAAGLIGTYMLGKASYIPECRRLILERLPNSNLANSLESKPYDLISDMAQPPEIVSKSTTTSIFGTRDENEEPPLDLVPADLQDKNDTRKFVTYDELRQRNRAEHTTKFAGPRAPRNDAPVANAPTPTSDSRSLLPPPLVTNDVKSPPVPNNASKRSNARKNQYGDEVYE